MSKQLSSPIFFQLTKFDSIEGIFEAVATAEVPDKTGEVCHYESTKPYYQKWSAGIAKATGGKSLGNIRAMHQPISAGKVTALDFDDENKQIKITGKIVDKAELEKMAEGLYSGVSQGGEYVEKWKEGEHTYYTANPSEISIVDNPCLAEASFQYVKADGEVEMRKFHVPEAKKESEPEPADHPAPPVEQGWRAKDGSFHKSKADALRQNQMIEAEEIVKVSTAGITKLMGQIEDKLDEDLYWKREFSDDERKKLADEGKALPDGSFPIESEQDLKNAIRAVGRAKDPAKAKEHIKTRAKALGLESLIPEEWHEKVAKRQFFNADVLKGLGEVARVACLLQELDWLHNGLEFEEAMEEDGSQNPEHLADIIKELCQFLNSLVEEETGELVEDKGGTGIEIALEAAAGLDSEAAAAILKFLKVRPGMKADHPAKKLAAALKKAEDEGFTVKDHHAHSDRVHAIHKCAGTVMQHCMKAMQAMHLDEDEDEDDEDGKHEKLMKSISEAADHLKKVHKGAHQIMEHCMKMGSAIEPDEDEDEHHHKLQKMQAVNTALEKTIDQLTGQLKTVLTRIDHLERQPAVRKGMPFDPAGHEAESGSPPVETENLNPYGALRLSPEAERRLRFGT